MLRRSWREALIAHIDGPVGFKARGSQQQTTRALILRGWLRTEGTPRPRQTFITDDGRYQLATALADWADAIVRVQEQAESRAPVRRERALQDAE